MKEYDRVELINDRQEYLDAGVKRGDKGTILGENRLPKGRIGVIIGNEGNGITAELIKASDISVRIPMTDKVESLNAGVAGSILMFEIFKGEN